MLIWSLSGAILAIPIPTHGTRKADGPELWAFGLCCGHVSIVRRTILQVRSVQAFKGAAKGRTSKGFWKPSSRAPGKSSR
jgi:hypothetical protein